MGGANKHDAFDWVNLGILLLTFVAAGAAAIEAKRLADLTNDALIDARKVAAAQAADTQNSLDLTKQIAVATRRAWVGPLDAKLENAPVAGKDLGFQITYQNTGREPGLGFRSDVEAYTFLNEEDGSQKVLNDLNAVASRCGTTKPDLAGQVVYPNNGFSNYQIYGTVQGRLVSTTVVNGDRTVMLAGCFVYVSESKVHHSLFCYFYKAKQSKLDHLNICRVGNFAD